ncbi:MAG: hypothetical protein PVJ21_23415 [Anaerolineales bacterium]
MSEQIDQSSRWGEIYILGGLVALGAVLTGIIEIGITFLPGGNAPQETVIDWFILFQENPFMGLRNLGLLNIFLNALGIPTYLALYAAHRKTRERSLALLTAIISYLGIGVFFATNRAFPMLALSNQYAIATSDAQRAMLEAAGQSMLSVGASHTPGTFLGFFLAELAGVLISVVMLRGGVFSKINAYVGILGFSILLVFEYFSSFISGLSDVTLMLSMFGGLLSMAWYILLGRRLFQLGQNSLEN